ncbi:hypothetical protein FISHEDRAFT_48274 [Fistulina hepatica ATCC 64428]|uniref:Elongation factor 1 alpha-like protein n=1 Tax=Fistulina hepatica ATCC 64428 TaxID=1128425 RepID=A0A0D7A6C2_9AGAR|nr:hypothetical protein FISHEDRAFT_48274 [Fistulina hepatica ATCC 64428]
MSRHRYVRNMNLQEEMDDDALSDGGDDMTPEQQEQMEKALDHVRQIIGDEATSGLSDNVIRDVLWDEYFDVEKTLDWCFEEQRRKKAADERKAAREAQKLAQRKLAEAASTATSCAGSPMPKKTTPKRSDASTPVTRQNVADPQQLDMSALNLTEKTATEVVEEPPKMTFAKEVLLEEAKKSLSQSKNVSLVVIGHVDAGKSTLMGRLLYELGRLDEKTRTANERGSSKIGKSSFSWAWNLDGTLEERERGITMDIATRSLSTPKRNITVLDAPGHKDFVPNMISGASQADCALLVVDASMGEFEAGFERGGQTREHLILVRSLGVSQVIVAINKLDQVNWDRIRYDDIVSQLKPFLLQSGFQASNTNFVPIGAMLGVNLVNREDEEASLLNAWYHGPTLVDLLDTLVPPTRNLMAPLRIPISNVFKGQSAGTAVTGRVCGGVVQVGERLRVLPGDETAIVKSIEVEEQDVPWVAAGSNATLYLTSIDPVHLNVGTVLCPPDNVVPLASSFKARIIVFDIVIPITAGASIELFHHSRDVSAAVSKLLATRDRANGKILKISPRMLSKGMSADVEITIRSLSQNAPPRAIPLETFAVNKDMGRVLLRRNGETVAAGVSPTYNV